MYALFYLIIVSEAAAVALATVQLLFADFGTFMSKVGRAVEILNFLEYKAISHGSWACEAPVNITPLLVFKHRPWLSSDHGRKPREVLVALNAIQMVN